MSATTRRVLWLHWDYFSERSYYCYISSLFHPNTMASFHHQRCWLLYFEVFLWLIPTNEWDHSLGLLLTFAIIFWEIILSLYIIIFSLSTMEPFQRHHCWFLYFEFFCDSLSWMSATNLSDCCLHWTYFSGKYYYCHILSFFPSQHNGAVLPSPLLIVIFWIFKWSPPHGWLQPLVGITDSIVITFLGGHIIALFILWSLIPFEVLCWAI